MSLRGAFTAENVTRAARRRSAATGAEIARKMQRKN
jgi:hypothetical protein